MLKRRLLVALMAAALVVQASSGAWANPKENSDSNDRDTRSRNELAALGILPLVLANNAQLRVGLMVFMMQNLIYSWQLQRIKVINENRVSVGGLLGGLFPTAYGAEHFVKSLEIGSVYRAGDGEIVVAMKGERRLEDYEVLVFNGDYQYIPQGRATATQVDPQRLAALGAIPIMNRIMLGQGSALDIALAATPEDAQSFSDLGVDMLEQIPQIRELMIGKIYRTGENTLLVVIPPAIVQDR